MCASRTRIRDHIAKKNYVGSLVSRPICIQHGNCVGTLRSHGRDVVSLATFSPTGMILRFVCTKTPSRQRAASLHWPRSLSPWWDPRIDSRITRPPAQQPRASQLPTQCISIVWISLLGRTTLPKLHRVAFLLDNAICTTHRPA
jgi:hypothetical protein